MKINMGYSEVIRIHVRLWYAKNSNMENVLASSYNGSGSILFLGSNLSRLKLPLDSRPSKERL